LSKIFGRYSLGAILNIVANAYNWPNCRCWLSVLGICSSVSQRYFSSWAELSLRTVV
jgi:hypothetical protein